jgi:Tfp pilus assembly PilM family ATPase
MLKRLANRVTRTPLLGVDIGSAAIKVVELAAANGPPLLRRCAVERIEDGNSAAALKRLVEEWHLGKIRSAVGLGSPEAVVKSFQVPSMSRKELVQAVQLEAEQSVLNGHAMSEMAVDWQTLPSTGGASIRGLLSVVPKSVITARLTLARQAGLQPHVIDVEGLALWNAYWILVGRHAAKPETVLLINVGARTSNLVIAKGPDELMLVRDLQMGAVAISQGQQDDWVTEVRDSLAYARAKGGLRALDQVYVSGGKTQSLKSLMATVVSVPITWWNPLDHLARDEQSPSIEAAVGPLLAIAVGLALRRPS